MTARDITMIALAAFILGAALIAWARSGPEGRELLRDMRKGR